MNEIILIATPDGVTALYLNGVLVTTLYGDDYENGGGIVGIVKDAIITTLRSRGEEAAVIVVAPEAWVENLYDPNLPHIVAVGDLAARARGTRLSEEEHTFLLANTTTK